MNKPRFKSGDKALLEGVGVVTIMSWPAENEGYVVSEQYNAAGNTVVRRTDYYGEVDGEPVVAAGKFSEYDGPEGYPLAVIGHQVTIEEAIADDDDDEAA